MRLSLQRAGLLVASLLLLAIPSLARPGRTAHLTRPVLKSAHPAPRHFVERGPAPGDSTVPLRLALAQRNRGALERRVLEGATPGHANFRRHLTGAEVRGLSAPEPEAVDAVAAWLGSHGVRPRDGRWEVSAGGWIDVGEVPVAAAEAMLSARYARYEDVRTGWSVLRAESYSLPRGVFHHIEVVHPTNYWGGARRQRSMIKDIPAKISAAEALQAVAGCSTIISPNCLRTLYGTMNYTATTNASFGIAGYLEEYASHSDLDLYVRRYRTDIPSATFDVQLVGNATYDESSPGSEANLDVQAASGVAYPTPITYYYTPGRGEQTQAGDGASDDNEPYLDWIDHQLSLDVFPYTVSTSYGDDERSVPYEYAARVCAGFMSMAARGQTLLFSSGDQGVGEDPYCVSGSPNATAGFAPLFPASCPYVTAVGATYQTGPEVAVSWSGAGFSNYFPRPGFQDAAVEGYLARLGSTHSGLYNRSGRAYPDVAAQALYYGVYLEGSLTQISGTSASTPAVAAVFAQLNDALVSEGKPPLGWANPWIYGNASSGFNDVTEGSSQGCGTTGFAAAEGWDPSTGWGTPRFPALRSLLP